MVKVFFKMVAFNAKDYIREAIDSVVAQTDKDWILYVVDNGSFDNTRAICEEYAKKDSRIICNHYEKNNTPSQEELIYEEQFLKEQLKDKDIEYFSFLDSDDYIAKDYVEKMYKTAKENDADFVACGTNMFNELQPNKFYPRIPTGLVVKDNKITTEQFISIYGTLRPMWGKLYRYSMKTEFDEIFKNRGEIHNGADTYSVLTFISNNNKNIVFINEALHFYRVREKSGYQNVGICINGEQIININRLYEGEILFNVGVKFAKHYNVFNNDVKNFLCAVYINHIRDIILAGVDSEEYTYDNKIEMIKTLFSRELFRESYSVISNLVDEMMNAAIKGLEKYTSRLRLNDYYMFKMYDDVEWLGMHNVKVIWLLSILCDKENTLHWGSDASQHVEYSKKDTIIKSMNKSTTNIHIECKQKTLDYIDENNLESAENLIDSLFTELPLDRDVLYFMMYIAVKQGKNEKAIIISQIAKVFYEDDEDILQMVEVINNLK